MHKIIMQLNNIPARQLLNLLIAVSISCLLYLTLDFFLLKHSAALFIGIPLFIGTFLSISSQVENLTRHILTGMLLGLITSFVVLNEGSFCVPMTAPLFIASGLILAYSFTKFKQSHYKKFIYLIPVLLLSALTLEGTTEAFSLNRSNKIESSTISSLTTEEIQYRLSQNRQILQTPALLSWGFPQATVVSGSGAAIGDFRDIYFSGGEGEPGHTIFKITDRSSNSLTFQLINDESHISHWLEWKTSKVSWQQISPDKTQITWEIEYVRKLDPAWYFGPLQKLAVKLAAKTLIDNLILAESK